MMKRVKTNELANSPPANALGGDGSCAFHPAFPLTPALSLGERENRSPAFGKRERGVCRRRVRGIQNDRMVFPLPRERARVSGTGLQLNASDQRNRYERA